MHLQKKCKRFIYNWSINSETIEEKERVFSTVDVRVIKILTNITKMWLDNSQSTRAQAGCSYDQWPFSINIYFLINFCHPVLINSHFGPFNQFGPFTFWSIHILVHLHFGQFTFWSIYILVSLPNLVVYPIWSV